MRRVAFYLFYDPQGRVDDYVLHALRGLRPHVEHVFVVSNAVLDEHGRERLESVADTVWERENVGFDVWAYKEAMERFGAERIAEHDELIMLNSTFLGPVGSFDPLFEQMAAREDLDFWGITEHGEAEKNPFLEDRPMQAHLQTHWIAVRRRMATSADWRQYWDEMPMITSYADSVLTHESRFTPWFAERGHTWAAAFPADDYDSPHPVMDNPLQMLRDGCPVVKRRTFFCDPLYNEWKANDGRALLREMGERGYPVDQALANLARTSVPRSLVTNAGLLEVLPEVDTTGGRPLSLRVVGIGHVFYPDMTDEILDRFGFVPGGCDLVLTTTDEEKRSAIREVLARRGQEADVRIVGSNRGRDISAFLVDCRDVLEDGGYDVVVKLHSKKQPQDPPNVSELFKRHMFDNLLSSPGHAANVLRLFEDHPSLGMVVPPVYHIAYPTLGHAWFLNKPRAEQEAERLGIVVPFDDTTPVSAYGSMFIARPEALRPLTSAGYTHEDFPDESGYHDGALTHVVERLMTYAALSTGHHVREVMNAELAATNYKVLEYRAIAIGAKLPAHPMAQLRRISKFKKIRKQALRDGSWVDESRERRLQTAEAEAQEVVGEPTETRRLPRWLRRGGE